MVSQVQDLKNADGFLGKMTGNVSDPFCEIHVMDFRNNSTSERVDFKVASPGYRVCVRVCVSGGGGVIGCVLVQAKATDGVCSVLGGLSLLRTS